MIALVSAAGLILFIWPFLGGDVPPDGPALAVAIGAVAALGLMEVGARRLDSGRLALLAALAAIDSALRLAMVTGVGGFSPIFFLVMCAGYEFGASYGFLVGSFSLLVSAVVTGGVGPWVPYETFAVGWVGASAGLAGDLVRRLARARETWSPHLVDLVVLVLLGIVTGFLYGVLLDTWDWVAFRRGVENIGWMPGMAPLDALAQFGRYYVLTSVYWDAFRAFGNAVAIMALGTPVLMALGRLRARLGFEIVEGPAAP
jgi:energy-coupling factor transport system substrate-specific component